MSKPLRILVVDDDHNMARTVADILRIQGYDAEVAHSGEEALEKVERTPFDSVLSDIKMPEIDGVELYRAIQALRPEMPVVLMTAYSDDSLVQEGLDEGAIGALTKPLNISLLLVFFSELCKERTILLVDDDPDFCQILGTVLEQHGYDVTAIRDPDQVADELESESGVILLDMKLNGLTGLDVLHRIEERRIRAPVILVTGYREQMAGAIEAALEIGAYTCLYKPIEIEQLLALLDEIHHRRLRSALHQPAEGG